MDVVWIIAGGLAAFGVGVWLRTLISTNRGNDAEILRVEIRR